MSSKGIQIAFILWALLAIQAEAQFKLPQIDIEAKGAGGIFDAKHDYVDNIYIFSYEFGAHIQINQHIAIGGFYEHSVNGKIKYNDNTSSEGQDIKMLITGVDLRLSAGRSVKWRPYISFNYSKFEFVQNEGTYNMATSINAMGVNLGIMLRLGNNFYWNVLELSGKYFKDKIYWLDTDLLVQARMGVTYNLRIKSK